MCNERRQDISGVGEPGSCVSRAEHRENHEPEKTVGGLLILAGFLSIDIYPAYDCEDAFVASSKGMYIQ